jgi:hypothetical protein
MLPPSLLPLPTTHLALLHGVQLLRKSSLGELENGGGRRSKSRVGCEVVGGDDDGGSGCGGDSDGSGGVPRGCWPPPSASRSPPEMPSPNKGSVVSKINMRNEGKREGEKYKKSTG